MTKKLNCNLCGEQDLKMLLKMNHHGVRVAVGTCKKCRGIQKRKWEEKNPEKFKIHNSRKREILSQLRKDPKNAPRFILMDCRNMDRKRNYENDLDQKFIEELIRKGCCYCRETEIRMSLDRIDNARGHTRDNVVPACHRCNFVRLDMPYEAWMEIAPAMRVAREKGAFGEWMQKTRTGQKKLE